METELEKSQLRSAQVYVNLFIVVQEAVLRGAISEEEGVRVGMCLRDVWTPADCTETMSYMDVSRRLKQLLGESMCKKLLFSG